MEAQRRVLPLEPAGEEIREEAVIAVSPFARVEPEHEQAAVGERLQNLAGVGPTTYRLA